MYWAILSGIQGNLTAYQAVLSDIKSRKNSIEEIYILGDLVGPAPESEKLVQKIRNPKDSELLPKVCQGWWEEQCLILHGLSRTSEPTDLSDRYGTDMVKKLWDCVSRKTVEWIRSLDFGFFELDCLLIHGSTVSVNEELTPDTPPLQMLDRIGRMGANNLFCGRSGLVFQYQIQEGSVRDSTIALEGDRPPKTVIATPKQAIGVGNVGRIPGKATYTLYNPGTNKIVFRTVDYGNHKGFAPRSPLA